ncbi:putative quinol monooxygenase [Novosphingobium sp. 9]|uniref:putative quinol monooxygenase n=1 Tax=Novosphingobium sp. 9 TaxID=2025349 RepID=UPI0021B57391|nr:antibiotic biosynthesis monooxygenase [Novosphingobium sp. 9]
MMIVITGQFRMPVAVRDQAVVAMAAVVAATRAEAGCLHYAYAEDVLEPGLFRVSEIWESREALTAHFAQPHMKVWGETRAALGFSDREITAHSVESSETL